MRFLLFTLYAPICSLGEISVGERRMGWARPGRSAVLGLVAAALGLEREDEDAHRKLHSALYFAVRTDSPGQTFVDYHTTQTPRAKKGVTFNTRREELTADSLGTVLSVREWRADACFTVALWPRPRNNVDLDELAAALKRPHFAPYLGRKSAPLGLPLDPRVLDADTFMAAFSLLETTEVHNSVMERIRVSGARDIEYAFDHDAPGSPPEARIERRRDSVVSRRRWQFADRFEGVCSQDGANR